MGRGRGGKNDQIEIETRRTQALDLRRQGYSYRAIAKALYVSLETAYSDVDTALKQATARNANSADDLRTLELQRLDEMLAAVYPLAIKGIGSNIDRVLKIMERRARYLGIDAPQAIEVIDWRTRAILDIKAGNVSFSDIVNAFDHSLAVELFASAGVNVDAG